MKTITEAELDEALEEFDIYVSESGMDREYPTELNNLFMEFFLTVM